MGVAATSVCAAARLGVAAQGACSLRSMPIVVIYKADWAGRRGEPCNSGLPEARRMDGEVESGTPSACAMSTEET